MTPEDYKRYRGTCKEYAEYLCAMIPELRLVRGHYHDPVWGTKEGHWWCEDTRDGEIIDPTKYQFGCGGITDCYEEFNGMCECSNCGTEIPEDEADIEGRYCFCSVACHCAFVGIDL